MLYVASTQALFYVRAMSLELFHDGYSAGWGYNNLLKAHPLQKLQEVRVLSVGDSDTQILKTNTEYVKGCVSARLASDILHNSGCRNFGFVYINTIA
jgi:hypothetical protein